jgi:hypothetical protein
MGKLRVVTQGYEDIVLVWTTPEEEERVRHVFEDYIRKGYMAIMRNQSGVEKPIKAFNPCAKEITMVKIYV